MLLSSFECITTIPKFTKGDRRTVAVWYSAYGQYLLHHVGSRGRDRGLSN